MLNLSKIKQLLTKKESTKEDELYYYENGLMVMTEAYHLQRGYCCGNRCRHCPYEHENVPSQAKTNSQ